MCVSEWWRRRSIQHAHLFAWAHMYVLLMQNKYCHLLTSIADLFLRKTRPKINVLGCGSWVVVPFPLFPHTSKQDTSCCWYEPGPWGAWPWGRLQQAKLSRPVTLQFCIHPRHVLYLPTMCTLSWNIPWMCSGRAYTYTDTQPYKGLYRNGALWVFFMYGL